MSDIPGTVRCVLCQAVLSFRQNDKSKFELHLQLEHMVNTDTDIILAVCLMDQEEVQAVKNVMFTKLQDLTEDPQENEEEAPVQTEVFSCENCKKIFKSKKSMRQHVLRKICRNLENSGAAEVVGDSCESDKETEVKTEYSDENITLEENPLVSTTETVAISCDNCNTIFKTKKILRRHISQRICLNKVDKAAVSEVLEDDLDEDKKEIVLKEVTDEDKKETVLKEVTEEDKKETVLKEVTEEDKKETVLKEVTEEDLAKSKYFSEQRHPVITRLASQTAVEDFNEEEILLPGWKYKTRQVFKDSKKTGVSKRKVFLTPNKKWRIRTSLGVLEYLRLQGRGRSQLSTLAGKLGVDRRRFLQLCRNDITQEAESLTLLSDEDISKSSYFTQELSKPIIRRVMKCSIPEFSEEDRMLPGWRIKSRLVRDHRRGRSQRKLRTFLTPGKNRSITTSTGVLEYLRLQGKEKGELAKVATHLGVDKTKFLNLYDF